LATVWRENAAILRRCANPMSCEADEAALRVESAGSLEFCAEQLEAALAASPVSPAPVASPSVRERVIALRNECAKHFLRDDVELLDEVLTLLPASPMSQKMTPVELWLEQVADLRAAQPPGGVEP